MASPQPSPRAPRDSKPGFTSAQSLAIEEIRSHLNYFTGIRADLESCLGENVNVTGVRSLFDMNPPPSKRAKKVVAQFNTAFNFSAKAVPKAISKSAPAGKSTSTTKSTARRQHQLSIIIQRLMDHERVT